MENCSRAPVSNGFAWFPFDFTNRSAASWRRQIHPEHIFVMVWHGFLSNFGAEKPSLVRKENSSWADVLKKEFGVPFYKILKSKNPMLWQRENWFWAYMFKRLQWIPAQLWWTDIQLFHNKRMLLSLLFQFYLGFCAALKHVYLSQTRTLNIDRSWRYKDAIRKV